ncbi:Endolytic peptidoglycan transglycosylase RlpA (plasmid) [Caballeronia sp. SBC1]|uniref:septal ring lytic transglycosylase RlpA family protein n=1 Tax=unclassified Caballeronia TaxID=2646786 RepID=UPI0013E145EB|nr:MULTISPECIES: septal ring lytic transglycosylase RlpA family protein [unclassified Caballeronia]QIE28069.1 Endolytic peptidoglycan transglycosylase RlpA [Caballeronia sp. SBC2]QIN66133.1 Endolytic peptidoglycan transglycosylase RlpA [Caballeronia sp. SBC1]
MKNDLHTTKNRLPGRLPEAELMRLNTQSVPVETALRLPMYEPGDHIDPVNHTHLQPGRRRKLRMLLFLVLSYSLSTAVAAQKQTSIDSSQASSKAARHAGLDRSGKARKGKASYYGREFYSKKMADGTRMNPQSNVAASKTLPLGTKARVTNLENGSNAVVEIRDRGPYVKNRIVDVSPKTADKLGLKENGTAPVEVKPLEVPQPDGSVKPGAGATNTQP